VQCEAGAKGSPATKSGDVRLPRLSSDANRHKVLRLRE
jgi:hypothetical protein